MGECMSVVLGTSNPSFVRPEMNQFNGCPIPVGTAHTAPFKVLVDG